VSATRLVAVAAFAAGGVGLLLLAWLARRDGSKIPTLGTLCGSVMRLRAGPVPVGRIAVYALWGWIGWHLFAR
jgi:hypothetical protein